MAKPIDEKYNEDILKAFLRGFSVDLNHLRVAVQELQRENSDMARMLAEPPERDEKK